MAEYTGQLLLPSRDNGRPVLRFRINENIGDLSDLADRELVLKVSRKTKKRSLDSNSYFHVLVDKLRQKLGLSFASTKNQLIASYGQIEYIGSQHAIIKSNILPEKMAEMEALHTSLIRADGDGVYWYRLYRGTHTYNTAEMSLLIDGTIQECQQQGIETATPDQLRHMAALWKEKHG